MHDVWVPNNSVKDLDCSITYPGGLFIVAEAYVELIPLFGWDNNKKKMAN